MACPKTRQCPKKPDGSLDYIFDKRPFCKRCRLGNGKDKTDKVGSTPLREITIKS
jgi:hypothetical protein